jgi:hypothetical protein
MKPRANGHKQSDTNLASLVVFISTIAVITPQCALNIRKNEVWRCTVQCQDAGEAARAAADKAEGAAPLVAGCLPPLTESYAVGTAALWDDAATTYSDV